MPEKKAESETRKNRLRLKLTQEEMAALVGVTVRTLASWDRGEREPSKPILAHIRSLKRKR